MIVNNTDSLTHNTDAESKLWYAMCAYKQEKKAKERLDLAQIENFVPLRYVIKEKNGKKIKALVPAIPNLVFVHCNKKILQEFKTTNPYLQYITRKNGSSNEIIVVPNDQMTAFISVAKHSEEDITYYSPEEIETKTGARVKIHGGVFDGLEGTLLKIKGKRSKRIVVKVDGLTAIATAEIHPDLIELL